MEELSRCLKEHHIIIASLSEETLLQLIIDCSGLMDIMQALITIYHHYHSSTNNKETCLDLFCGRAHLSDIIADKHCQHKKRA